MVVAYVCLALRKREKDARALRPCVSQITCPWVRDREPLVRAPAGVSTWLGLRMAGCSVGRGRRALNPD